MIVRGLPWRGGGVLSETPSEFNVRAHLMRVWDVSKPAWIRTVWREILIFCASWGLYIYIYMATAHSVIHIFAPNCVFPKFYSKNGPKKGGVNLLSLFWGHVFGCPKHGGGNGDGPRIPYKTRHFSDFCIWFPCRQDLYFQQQKWHFPPF